MCHQPSPKAERNSPTRPNKHSFSCPQLYYVEQNKTNPFSFLENLESVENSSALNNLWKTSTHKKKLYP